MNKKQIVNSLNKLFEDMGAGMVSAAAGLPGIESLPKKKSVIKNYQLPKENKKKSPM